MSDKLSKEFKEMALKQKQSLPLEAKIILTKRRLREWYEYWEGDIYISFSGGKDSTVLLDIARQMHSNIEAVFCDTGLEYPEIKEFVKTKENVTIIKPKINFKKVISKYGYPVISKEQSHYISKVRNTKSEVIKNKHLNGINKDGSKSQFVISKKWKYMIDAPFEISDKCCEVMKKAPFKEYEKRTGKKAIMGTMAQESNLRKRRYLEQGCNAFERDRPISTPLAFWTEQDILIYIYIYKLMISKAYGDVVKETEVNLIESIETYRTTLCKRTGCIFCVYGCHLEKEPNRFQLLKKTHPKIHKYCMEELEIKKVLDYMKLKSE
ncbi:TPA: phosphoadenosine phosphosulfate reductase family protein [Clostridioides difficile]